MYIIQRITFGAYFDSKVIMVKGLETKPGEYPQVSQEFRMGISEPCVDNYTR